ncbi:disulfide isomerase [Lentinus tigrinus ALCF2SS1-7]|uniref:Protein disulfide-isomerase n=1 Tax=Lentinus tigrinus ALCF2SS1-6 TaxID=1328759 RepID=A0A5C2SW05_9APHY|nr:disulfide isomerase [Lentinus tigrinus ALCF2SS1-6]RPD81110.1 disulfide isomerase [Lentinus tigrinus ALCF2SS1-7]
MRVSRFLSSAAALAFIQAVLASDVIDLTPATFDSTVNPESLMLVEFFAPWCGHCKALAPHYEEAATALKEKNIKLAKVNCVDEADLCQSNGIQGYPTLRVYRNGEYTEYTGPRKADGIIGYMTKQSLPAVSEVTKDNFDDFKTADKLVAIAFVSSSTDAPAAEFSATASKHRDDYLFGLSTDPEVAAAAGVTPPAIVVFRSFDEPQTEYPYPIASAQVKDIETWIGDLSIPIIDEVGADNYQTYASSGKPLAYLFVDPTDEKHDEYVNAIKPVAAKYKGKINFVWIDAIKYGDHARALNLLESKWPSFVIQDLQKQLKYPFDQSKDLTAEAAEEQVELFLDHKLEPQLKSQPIPEVQDEPVFNLVGKQFEEIVLDDERDVFVEFYASWCGHCKRLKPTWDSLGEHFAGLKDRITIAKMEATENDLPPSVPFRISGFPTLKFKPAGTHDFIDYDGDRSLESLIAFVEENAKNPLDPKVPFGNSTPAQEGEQVVMEDGHRHEEL